METARIDPAAGASASQICRISEVAPTANRLKPMPMTIWFARAKTVPSASTAAASRPPSMPAASAVTGEPLTASPSAEAEAPNSINPSSPIVNTPARSETVSPSAASSTGTQSRNPPARNRASVTALKSIPASLSPASRRSSPPAAGWAGRSAHQPAPPESKTCFAAPAPRC